MSCPSVLRQDILSDELKTFKINFRVVAQTQFNTAIDQADHLRHKQRTVGSSKNIFEAMELIQQSIEDYQRREGKTQDAAVEVIYNRPDDDRYVECISIEIADRLPGLFSQNRAGRPSPNRSSGEVRNLRPLLRETVNDTEAPGYRRAIYGYYYDNWLRLTCWARTNKHAIKRMLWLENVMHEYTWFLGWSGVSRVIYLGQTKDQVEIVNGNKFYGKPVEFFVRTEKIRTISEKTLEEITINLSISDQ